MFGERFGGANIEVLEELVSAGFLGGSGLCKSMCAEYLLVLYGQATFFVIGWGGKGSSPV